VIQLIIRLLQYLSLRNIQGFGAFLGLLAYIGSSSYRTRLKTHLNQAASIYSFTPNPWEAAKGAGMMLADSLWIWAHPLEALALTQTPNWEVVTEAINEGKGIIVITPHIGAFEIIPRVLAKYFPATILYRPAKQSWLSEIIEKGRAHPKMNFAPANLQGVRELAKALHRGECVGLLPDQVPGVGDGVWVKFFGRHAYTAVLPAKIAQRKNIPTVYFSAARLDKGKGWIIEVERMKEEFSDNPTIAATQLNKELEKVIIKFPNQYLWGYNRYKQPRGVEAPPEDGLGISL
jgi:KDO2-lipid IV(A) lauroyltransferase